MGNRHDGACIPMKIYRVSIVQETTYTVEVVAESPEEARSKGTTEIEKDRAACTMEVKNTWRVHLL